MPKVIKNPLREGLPSKVYFLAYSKPTTGMDMARKLYHPKKKSNLPASKIYKIFKDYSNYFEIQGGKKLSKKEYLLAEVDEALNRKKIYLRDFEKRELSLFLGNQFRKYVRSIEPDLTGDFNTSANLIKLLSFLAVIQLVGWKKSKMASDVPHSLKKKFHRIYSEKLKNIEREEGISPTGRIELAELKEVENAEKGLSLSLLKKLVELDETASAFRRVLIAYKAGFLTIQELGRSKIKIK
jgi:hypothetical protein